jgi:hypothetical protein
VVNGLLGAADTARGRLILAMAGIICRASATKKVVGNLPFLGNYAAIEPPRISVTLWLRWAPDTSNSGVILRGVEICARE